LLSRRRSLRRSLSSRPHRSSRRLLLKRREDDLSPSLLGRLGSSGAQNALLNYWHSRTV
jgi:hypothetical protein